MRCETNSFIHQSSQQHKCRSAHKNHLPSTRHVALSSISQLLPQQQYPPPCPALPAPTCQSPLLPRPLPLRPVTDPWTVVPLPPPPRASLPPRTTRRKPRPRARSKVMKIVRERSKRRRWRTVRGVYLFAFDCYPSV